MVEPKVLITRRWPEAVEAMLTQNLPAVRDTADKLLMPTVTDGIGAPAPDLAPRDGMN